MPFDQQSQQFPSPQQIKSIVDCARWAPTGRGWDAHCDFVGEGDLLARVTFTPRTLKHSLLENAVRFRMVVLRSYRPDPIPFRCL